MIITLTGPNDFARTLELKKLAADFLREHDEMAIERLDGDDASAATMQAAAQSLPFLAARKLVILREPGKQKAWAENIDTILQQVADTTDLIIIEPKLDKRLTYYKTLKKKTDFREYTTPDANGLAHWAVDYAKAEGGSLAAADARLLIDRVGPDQQLIASELTKLLAYDPHITKASIELLTEKAPQSTVFELLDAAVAGKTARALELYREQRALKVEPQAIIAMLAWQLHVLAIIATAGQRGGDDIAREAKLNPFVVRKSQAAARAIGLPALKQHIARLLELDEKLKTITIDADQALTLYLLQLGGRE